MRRLLYYFLILATTACTKSYDVPSQYTDVNEQAPIYPDYRDIVIPQNIAPLNFMVKDAKGLVAVFEGTGGHCLTVSGEDRIDIDSAEWRGRRSAQGLRFPPARSD